MDVKSFFITDIGRVREKNEDSYLVCKELNLFAVADGMGGHEFGEIASRMAVETLKSSMMKYRRSSGIEKMGALSSELDISIENLKKSIEEANKNIYEFSKSKARTEKGMGTTIVVVYIVKENAIIAHVGDSRVYRIRNGEIIRLTKDHSFVEMQIERGLLTRAEARVSSFRNLITKALGVEEYVEVDIQSCLLKEDDVFLLCSDGLTDKLEDEEILNCICKYGKDFESGGKELIELANERGGHDNITVVIVGVETV